MHKLEENSWLMVKEHVGVKDAEITPALFKNII
jgi:hypothetical protein